MTKELYSELNEAQKFIYTPSMIGRTFENFDFSNICTIYTYTIKTLISSKQYCIVKRTNGNEEKYDAEPIKSSYSNFIKRTIPFFSYLGPNYRGPIPWINNKNTYILLKGWNYLYENSYKTPEAIMQRKWINSFNNIKDLNVLKTFLENSNDDDPEEEIIPDVKESLGHVIVPGKTCSCKAFQKQSNNLDLFKEEFGSDYKPYCKHLVWYDNFKKFQLERQILRDKLEGKIESKVSLWFYTPSPQKFGKGIFKIYYTDQGIYSKQFKTVKNLTQDDAWEYFTRMIKAGYLPYEGSLVPKISKKS